MEYLSPDSHAREFLAPAYERASMAGPGDGGPMDFRLRGNDNFTLKATTYRAA
jgi:hypothetical protein